MATKTTTVVRKERISFDNHQVHVTGEGIHGVLQLESESDFDAIEHGSTVEISISGVAKKVKQPKTPKAPKTPAAE